MTDEPVTLQACPRDDCDDPVYHAFRTDTAFQIRPVNAVYDKWCLIPRVDPGDGEFWVYVVIHDDREDFQTGKELADETKGSDDGDEPPDEPDEGAAAYPDEDTAKDVVLFVEREGRASFPAIAGLLVESGREYDDIRDLVGRLVDEGYLEEWAGDFYQRPEE